MSACFVLLSIEAPSFHALHALGTSLLNSGCPFRLPCLHLRPCCMLHLCFSMQLGGGYQGKGVWQVRSTACSKPAVRTATEAKGVSDKSQQAPAHTVTTKASKGVKKREGREKDGGGGGALHEGVPLLLGVEWAVLGEAAFRAWKWAPADAAPPMSANASATGSSVAAAFPAAAVPAAALVPGSASAHAAAAPVRTDPVGASDAAIEASNVAREAALANVPPNSPTDAAVMCLKLLPPDALCALALNAFSLLVQV